MPVTREEFEAVFPKLVDDLSAHAQQYNIPDNALAWYQQVYNTDPPPLLLRREYH